MLDIDFDKGRWPGHWKRHAVKACQVAVAHSWAAALSGTELQANISIKLADDARVASLNGQFRNKHKPTNVLSFPMMSADDLVQALRRPTQLHAPQLMLGDIILARETCQAEAEAMDIPLADHYQHLIAHGVLHLLGYDHVDDAQAFDMEQLERAICAELGVRGPYGDM